MGDTMQVGYDQIPEAGTRTIPSSRYTILKAAIGCLSLAVIGLTIGLILVATRKEETTPDGPAPPEPGVPTPPPPPAPIPDLVDAMDITRLMGHLQALQNIANAHGGGRAAANGYNASVTYVVEKLTAAGYTPTIQEFNYSGTELVGTPWFGQLTPSVLNYTLETDYAVVSGSGGYNSSEPLTVVKVRSLGCNPEDYSSFAPFSAALVIRGNCTFLEKANMAYAFNASAILVYNDGLAPDRFGVPPVALGGAAAIPVLGLTFMAGHTLGSEGCGTTIGLYVDSYPVTYTSMNVIADTAGGRSNRIVVSGSHLDSVPTGPGINDNGSGSALNLEMALQLKTLSLDVANKVRFIWFGAEESGLLGSHHYVDSLVANNETANIALNLNFDMVGSPNYERGIYNGTAMPNVRNGSVAIRRVFENYFASVNLTATLTPFTGRSDYGPFLEVGIPAGGLFTGAEVQKPTEIVALMGGIQNTAYDPCYHEPCDNIHNINQQGYIEMARAGAAALQTFGLVANLDELLEMQD